MKHIYSFCVWFSILISTDVFTRTLAASGLSSGSAERAGLQVSERFYYLQYTDDGRVRWSPEGLCFWRQSGSGGICGNGTWTISVSPRLFWLCQLFLFMHPILSFTGPAVAIHSPPWGLLWYPLVFWICTTDNGKWSVFLSVCVCLAFYGRLVVVISAHTHTLIGALIMEKYYSDQHQGSMFCTDNYLHFLKEKSSLLFDGCAFRAISRMLSSSLEELQSGSLQTVRQ